MSPKMRDISSSAFAPSRKMSFVTRVVLASALMAAATCETPLYAGNGSTPLPSGTTLPQSADSALKVPSAPEEADAALLKSSSQSEEKKPTEVEQDICRLGPMPPDSNKQCLAILPRWTYNATEGKCVPYLYGGCGGTANLFVAEADCQAACPRKQAGGQKQDDSAAAPEVDRKLRSDDCSLKLDGGTCYGFFRKWGFNQETGRCEWFVYGGCGGNANRFDRAESCQDACGGSEPLMDTECDKSKCEWGLWGHYEVKKCVPVYERGECCPTRFECPTKAVVEPGSEPSCTYKGKTYPVGARMPEVTEAEPCQASCFCQKLSEGVTKVTCASVECPDLFGVPGTRGCKRIYEKPNQCCASTYNCNKTVEAEDYLCEREGRQYLRGEKIFTSREEGLTCLCNDAFVEGGLNSSACLKVQCAWESVYHDRLQRDCTPVYFNEGGCPIDWVCPGDKGEKVDTLPIRPKKLEPTPLDGTPAAAQSSSEEKASSSSETEADSARESRARASDESGERPAAVLLPSASPPSAASNVCLLIPKADDKCETKSQKWFYNAIAGACEAYAEGCAKSDNRFDTKEACESACAGSPDGCSLETERGRCKARVPAWHFDKESGECKSFFYGGCGGNQNNFRKLELCESSCKNRAKPAAIGTAGATLSDDAQSPGAPQVSGGLVRGSDRRGDGKSYKSFVPDKQKLTEENEKLRQLNPRANSTDGADENNQAHSEKPVIPVVTLTEDNREAGHLQVCSMPMDRGPCYGAVPRYYFDLESATCKAFRYGGCRGNPNNFRTLTECNSACGRLQAAHLTAVASDSKALGSSDDSQTQLGIDSSQTTISGPTPHLTSSTAAPEDPCTLPAEVGPCRSRKQRFYFDVLTGECASFFYGECRGNANNFLSLQECQDKCQASLPRSLITEALGSSDDSQTQLGIVSSQTTVSAPTPHLISSTTAQEDPCTLPAEVGPCRSRKQRFYHDALTGECASFFYGGCRGNANNFVSLQECQNKCQASLQRSLTTKALGSSDDSQTQLGIESSQTTVSAPTPHQTSSTTAQEDPCTLPAEVGPCRSRKQRFYFDALTGECASFFYGGCRGNANNFLSLQECQDKCQASVPRSLTTEAGSAGSDGDSQTHLSIDSSPSTVSARTPNPASPPAEQDDPCALPAEVGPCRSRKQRFYFDALSGECASFFYGGCRGNANNFLSLQECQDKCLASMPRSLTKEDSSAVTVSAPMPNPTPSAEQQDPCTLPAEVGACRARKQRFYFDVSAGKCAGFFYGGCRGNANNFLSLQQCQDKCQAPAPRGVTKEARCYLPEEVGPCKAEMKKFVYDDSIGGCREFIYGGCKGNQNRFSTIRACQAACGGEHIEAELKEAKTPSVAGSRKLEDLDNQGNPLRCTLGSETFRLGTGFLPESNSCYQCRCSTPPSLTCQEMSRLCPASPGPEYTARYEPGKCCPSHELEPQIVGAGLAPPQVAAAVGDDEAAPGAEMTYP